MDLILTKNRSGNVGTSYEMKFAFVVSGQSVTKKRIEILALNMKKKGAKILNLEDINWDKEESKQIFIAVSPDFKYEVKILAFETLGCNKDDSTA